MSARLLFLALCFWPVVAESTAELIFAPPPRLATTAEELEAVRGKADFIEIRDRTVAAAETFLRQPVELPDGPGQWIFFYHCKYHGHKLDPINPNQHRCPVGNRVFSDARTRAAYRTILHHRAERAALKLGWAYAYTGDDRYVAEVQRTLLHFADAYNTYPSRQDRHGQLGAKAKSGGRRFANDFAEGYSIIDLCKAYDLTRSSPLWTDEQKQHVEQDFFRATADSLLKYNTRESNHQSWVNAGLMTIGSVLGDATLVKHVMSMRGGFYDQLKRGVGENGFWHEGSIDYHFFALAALIEIADAGRRLGLNPHRHKKFRAMFDAPLRCVYPNGWFPAVNDSKRISLADVVPQYLWAWRVFNNRRHAYALVRGGRLEFAEFLDADDFTDPTSTVLEDLGLAVLSRGSGAQVVYAAFDFGAHGGAHGHADKLNLMLFANDREWLLDPGRLSYAVAMTKTWSKSTAAHNTVAINGQSQRDHTGTLLHFEVLDNYVVATGQSKQAYRGHTLTRYLLLTDQMLLDLFKVSGSKPVTIDWFAHANSARLDPLDAMPRPRVAKMPRGNGYQHMKAQWLWQARQPTRWRFTAENGTALTLHLPAGQETFIIATGVGYKPNQRVPTLIRRRSAASTVFATVYDLSGRGSYVQKFTTSTDGGRAVYVVDTADGSWRAWIDGAKLTAQLNKPAVDERAATQLEIPASQEALPVRPER